MNPTLQAILAAWGAVVSTTLAVLQLVKHFRDRPDLRIDAELNFTPATPEQETKGRKVPTTRGLQEALILVRVANAGQKPSQVTACYVDLRGNAGASRYEVVTEDMPTLLNPNTCAQYLLQTEWLESDEVSGFGVLDALGARHAVASDQLRELAARCQALPGAMQKLPDPATGELTLAFHAKDRGVIRRLRADA